MKKCILILIIPFLSFGQNNWSYLEKENFVKYCIEGVGSTMSYSDANEYCTCMLGFSMSKWKNGSTADEAVLKMTKKELMEMAAPCMPSSNGKWPEEIQKEFVQECIRAIGDSMPYTASNSYCICTLNISMEKWPSIGDAYFAFENMTSEQMINWVSPCIE